MSTDSTNKKSRHFNKKTLFLLILGSIFVVTIIGILIGSAVQKNNESKFNLDSAISQAIKEYNSPDEPDTDIYPTESHFIYSKKKTGNQITVYLTAYYEEYTTDNPLGIVEQYSGSWCPCALTFQINEDGNYELLEYWEAEDGSLYASSIQEKFPFPFNFFALYNIHMPHAIDTSEVYEYFNENKTVTFVSADSGHLFCEEKGDATLTLNTKTNYATLNVNGKEIFTDFYCFFDFDENGDKVPVYIYLTDVNSLPDSEFEYDFTVIDENTLRVTNLPEAPTFTRVTE